MLSTYDAITILANDFMGPKVYLDQGKHKQNYIPCMQGQVHIQVSLHQVKQLQKPYFDELPS
jgi:hypothetical protein